MERESFIEGAVKSIPAIAPGGITLIASWLGYLEIGLSISLLILSILFLLWRWRIAYLKTKAK
jgi:hypothetical protein|tara:strand:+ start:2641 stop:2829 length:189 start_codon:yes stop_codon:yes gene_type:complete